jgi:uncharacterized protein (TIGR02996 family)
MEDEAFIRAILDEPSEAARLVYADWLDERNDPRGEFLRLYDKWQREATPQREPDRNTIRRLNELRGVINPDWAAFMVTLAMPPEPFVFGLPNNCLGPESLPLGEELMIRRIPNSLELPSGLVTFASQFRSVDPLDSGLAADLRILVRMAEKEECSYGASDYYVYPFLAELPAGGKRPTVAQIVGALKGVHFRREDRDRVTTAPRHQGIFKRSEDDEEIVDDDYLIPRDHVTPAAVRFVTFHVLGEERWRWAVDFAVGPSPRGKRLVGVVTLAG